MSIDPDPTVAPEYDQAYYDSYEGSGYRRDGELMALAHHFADGVVRALNPSSVLDVGCALGFVVEALRARGVEAFGVDVSEYAISQVAEEVAEFCSVGSLLEPLGRRVDLVMCIEVIEHLPAEDASDAVASLCAASDRILLSSTPDDFEEPSHLNVQPTEYWSALFAQQGFFRRIDFDATFISPWAVLYERRPADLVEVVRSYDRAVIRQQTEIHRVRGALLDLNARLVDATGDASGSRPDLEQRVEELQAEILDLRHDRLRMIDELESTNRRLGAALGRTTELEAEIGRLQTLETRYDAVVRSRSWRLMWALAAPYRALRFGARRG